MIYASHSIQLHSFHFLNHCCCYYCCFLRQTFLSPSHWLSYPAHYFENHFLGCMLLQSVSWEVYQEKEFNVQDSSSVRGWECSCLAKTFHCSRKGSQKTSQLPGALHAAPRPWDPPQPLHKAWSLSIPISVPCTQATAFIFTIPSLQMNPAELTGWENRRLQSQQISAGLKASSFGARITRWVLPALMVSDVV